MSAGDPSKHDLTQEDGRALLARARRSLCRHLGVAQAWEDEAGATPFPAQSLRRSAFVSLHSAEGLRGCLGAMDPTLDLGELVEELAMAAATRDPRFPPLEAAEVERVRIEISILSPLADIRSVAEIRIGRHGLAVGRGPRRGILLPQVALEHGWDAETFLAHTCLKAGLERQAWRPWATGRDDTLQVQVFSALLLGEDRR